jgi:hypothetical protein
MPRVVVPVQNLALPQALRVGRVTFRPPGWLARYAERPSADGTAHDRVVESARTWVDPLDVATADVALGSRAVLRDARASSAARAAVSDAVAVLRLYQHARYPHLDNRLQTFGLAHQTSSSLERYVILDGRTIISFGYEWTVMRARFGFSREDVQKFHTDPRFAWLSQSLAGSKPTVMQMRVLTALRAYSAAVSADIEALQVVLLAVALEALHGDAGTTVRGGEQLRVVQRAAYLYCGAPTEQFHSRSPACAFLSAKDGRDIASARRAAVDAGTSPTCTWFDALDALLQRRNRVLHEGLTVFPRRTLGWDFTWVAEVLLATVGWAQATGAGDADALQSELEAFIATTP